MEQEALRERGDDVRLASGQRTVKIQLILRDRTPAAHGMHGEAVNPTIPQNKVPIKGMALGAWCFCRRRV